MRRGRGRRQAISPLVELWEHVSKPGAEALASHAAQTHASRPLSKSTVRNIINGTTNPRRTTAESFIHGCLSYARSKRIKLDGALVTPNYWLDAFDRAILNDVSSTQTQKQSGRAEKQDYGGRREAVGFQLRQIGEGARRGRLGEYVAAPSYLLDANQEVVPYRSRQEDRDLIAWRDDSTWNTSILLIHGEGGAGKTRLARHFCTKSEQVGWLVAEAVEAGRLIPPSQTEASSNPAGGRIVIIDYAERWPRELLAQMIRDITSRFGQDKLRILILARAGDVLWEMIKASLYRDVEHLARPISLSRFTANAASRASAFNEAVTAFQEKLGWPARQLPLPAGRRVEADRSPLDLHMIALVAAWAHHEGRDISSSEDFSDFLLAHERNYWFAYVDRSSQLGRLGVEHEQIASLVLIATLFGPVAQRRDAQLILELAGLADSVQNARRLLATHRQLYFDSSGKYSYLLPLTPDRFAEDFLASQFRQADIEESIIDILHSIATVLGTGPGELMRRRAIQRIAATAPRHAAADDLIRHLVENYPNLLSYSNSSGVSYWLYSKEVILRGGRSQTIYFFARKSTWGSEKPIVMPSGFSLKENPRNGFLTIARDDG